MRLCNQKGRYNRGPEKKRKTCIVISAPVKGVQVSIEGPEHVHDGIRGKGSFASSLRGIERLLGAGIKVTLNVTLSRINARHASDLVSLALSLGVQRLGFSRLVPSGRGRGLMGEMLSANEVKKLYETLFSKNSAELSIVTGDPVATRMRSGDRVETGAVPFGGCAAGISGLTILPDGTVTPCRRLNIPVGNVRKDSLREIWATSETLNLLRDKGSYKGKCASCPSWANCRGCRAIAYACSQARGENDFLSEDPQCFI